MLYVNVFIGIIYSAIAFVFFFGDISMLWFRQISSFFFLICMEAALMRMLCKDPNLSSGVQTVGFIYSPLWNLAKAWDLFTSLEVRNYAEISAGLSLL